VTAQDDLPPAGWYADPHGARMWRYWDGKQWTDHVAPQTLEQLPAAALEDERRWAGWARAAFAAYVLLVAGTGILGALAFDDLYHGTLFDANAERVDAFSRSTGLMVGYQVCAFASLAIIAVLAAWTYRAARTARTLGIPIRREPGLGAAAWFIPILNLWWPPQTIRSFVPDRAQLRVAIEWWVCWIVTSLAMAGSLITAGASSLGAAIPFVVVAVLGALAFAILGFHVVRIVFAVHEAMVAGAEPHAEPTRG
jgi:uncharacterized protein DUF4328/uncharacterized protein DUF2510